MIDRPPFEIPSSRSHHRVRKGGSGTRIWECSSQYLAELSWQPIVGISYFTEGWENGRPDWRDRLVCVNVNYEPIDTPRNADDPSRFATYSYWRITAQYSSSMPIDGNWKATVRGSGKFLSTGRGRHWASDGAICTQSQAVFIPECQVSFNKTFPAATQRINQLINAQGCVNATVFNRCGLVYGPNTLRLDTYDVDMSADDSVGLLHTISLNFSHCPAGFNRYWREPEPLFNSDGSPQIYGGQQVFSGTAGWDGYVESEFMPYDFEGFMRG